VQIASKVESGYMYMIWLNGAIKIFLNILKKVLAFHLDLCYTLIKLKITNYFIGGFKNGKYDEEIF